MAMASPAAMFMIFLMMATYSQPVRPFDFDVGDTLGWVIPPHNDTKFYNDWASENRFLIHDTLRFRYKKDSVMTVSEAGYKNCNSTRPISFSNTGNTVIELSRGGLFYFISGATGHCQRGQRMIVKVMSEQEEARSSSASTTLFPLFCYGGTAFVHLLLSYHFAISQAA